MKSLGQDARGALRKMGLRFGAYHIFLPNLLKPAPRSLAVLLWGLAHGDDDKGIADVQHMAGSGRTSFPADKSVSVTLYRVAGYRLCGERAVRVDILERLADLIRPAIHYRPGVTPGEPPPGTADGDSFVVTPAMVSLTGSSGEGFASVLRALNYTMETRKGPAITVALRAAAAVEPVQVATDAAAAAVAVEIATTLRLVANPDEPELPFDLPVSVPAPEAVAEPVAVEAEVAEILPDAAGVAEPVAVEGVADAPMIEVWRPQRHNAHARLTHARPRPGQRRPRRDDHRPQASAGAPAEGGEAAAAAPEGPRPPRRERGRRDGLARHFDAPRPQAAPGEGGAPEGQAQGEQAANGEAPAPRFERPRRDDRPRHERPQGDRPQGDRPRQDRPQGGRGDRPQGERPQGERPFGDRPPRRDGDRRPQGGRPDQRPAFASTEAPKSRDRAPDPDSPFAKLLALKASLEAQSKKS